MNGFARAMVMGLALTTACTEPPPEGVELAAPTGALPFDAGAIAQRIHFAFRADGALFTSEHTTHAAVMDGASLRLTPILGRPDPAESVVGAALTVTTRSVRRDGELTPGASVTVDDRGRLVRAGDRFTEVLENGPEGVELSWAFDERPAGRGALEVRVEASGLEHVGDTDGGIHFRDPISTLGVRFGHATWIDAAGRRAPVRVHRDGEELVMRVPAELLERSSFPAVLDPVIGPEVAVDTPISGSPSRFQSLPSVAYGGGQYFVAWSDNRNPSRTEVVGTRVSAAGVVLDPNGILVGEGTEPSVVFDGTNFLVVWMSNSVYGQRFDAAGRPFRTRLVIASGGPVRPFAVHRAGTTLVACTVETPGGRVVAVRRIIGGATLEASPIVVSRNSSVGKIRAAASSNGWLITWEGHNGIDREIYAVRVSSAGAVLDTTPISVATGLVLDPWPASDGTDYFVVFQGERIRGRRVASATGALTPLLDLGDALDLGEGSEPSVAFVGGQYVALWGMGATLHANRVTSAGVALDGTTGFVIGAIPAQSARIYATGAGAYVVWSAEAASDSSGADLFGSRLSAALVLQDVPGVRLSASASGQTQVALASNGVDFLAAWRDDRDGVHGVYGARVSGATGQPLDAPAILLSPGGRAEQRPAISWNGTHWLVTWYDGRSSPGLYGTRVSTAGAVVDPGGLSLVTEASGAQVRGHTVDLASDGAGWLVVWSDGRGHRAYGARIAADGTNVGPASGMPISNGAFLDESFPRVAYGAGQYFVTWRDTDGVRGCRVSVAGAILDPAGVTLWPSTGDPLTGPPDVALVSSDFVVVFAYYDGSIRVARVAPATGAVLSTSVVATGLSSGFTLAWDDGVGYLAHRWSSPLLTRFRADGTDLDPVDRWIGTGATPEGVAIATIPGRALVAYTRYDATPGVTAMRVVTRTIDRDVLGASCTGDLGCESGHCVDGVCCDSACGGGATDDCQACSVARGAIVNGTCEPRPAATTCRDSTDACDPAETCDGIDLLCPVDALASGGVVCREAVGVCDVVEACTGSTAACPADDFAPSTTTCRASAGDCDVAEACTGSSTSCPSDVLAPSSSVCRIAAGECDVAESCTGSAADCPGDAARLEGTACGGAPSGECDAQDVCLGAVGATAACDARFLAAAISCRAASCASDTETLAASCTGDAALCPAPMTRACAPFTCGADACLTGCVTDAQCAGGHACDSSGACVPHEDLGGACTRDAECGSGRCVDAVCCDTACSGQCEACDVAGAEGSCAPIVGAPRGGRAACTTDGSACGGSCDGTLRDACTYPDAVCRSGSCTSGVAIVEAHCDGAGACPAETTLSCAPFVCADTSCAGDCAIDADCDAGGFCSAGVCTIQLDDGSTCDRARQCGSGECVDGVCCESACEGQCEACDVAGTEGVCSAAMGAPHGARAACVTDGTSCGGACDGATRDACVYADASIECGDATCEDAVATAIGTCDGAGMCDGGGSHDCAPYACGESACLAACDGGEDCAGGTTCAAGECVEAELDGGTEVADAGTSADDAGLVLDGGTAVEPDGGSTVEPPAGCGCAVPGGERPAPTGALAFGLLAISWMARRRRARWVPS